MKTRFVSVCSWHGPLRFALLAVAAAGCRSTSGQSAPVPARWVTAPPVEAPAPRVGQVAADPPGSRLPLTLVAATPFSGRLSPWRIYAGPPGSAPLETGGKGGKAKAGHPAWLGPGFDDSLWVSRTVRPGQILTPLAPAGSPAAIHPHPTTPLAAAYYRKRFIVVDRRRFRAVVVNVTRGDGAIVYLNGVEIGRDTRPLPSPRAPTPPPAPGPTDPTPAPTPTPPRPATPARPATPQAPTLPASPPTPYTFRICVPPDRLVDGENFLAVEVRRRSPDHNDLTFELEATGNDGISLTRGPYLQNGTTTSAVVRWRTDCPAETRLAVGAKAGAVDRLFEDRALKTEHEVKIDELLPDSRYFYAVAAMDGSEIRWLTGGTEDTSFLTPPEKARPTRVWVLGDAGTKDDRAAAVRDAYLAYAGARAADVWLMLGDNAYNSGTDTEYQAAVFDMYPRLLRQTFLWPAIGNHETAQAHDTAHVRASAHFAVFTMPTAGEGGGMASGTENYYSFNYGDIHFVNLDSMTTSTEPDRPKRSYPTAMLEWLKSDLGANTRPWVITYFHHPAYTKGTHDSDSTNDYESALVRRTVLPVLEAHGVDLVLAGHSHVYERSFLLDGHYGPSASFAATMKKDPGSGRPSDTGGYVKPAQATPHAGVVYIVAGSGGATQEKGLKLNHPAMYIGLARMGSLVLDVDGPRLDAAFVRDTGFIDDHFTLFKGAPSDAPPKVTMTASAANEKATAGASFTLTATASDDGHVARVDFFRSPRELVASDAEPPYGATWAPGSVGSYQIYAEAIDDKGAVAMSVPVNVTVQP